MNLRPGVVALLALVPRAVRHLTFVVAVLVACGDNQDAPLDAPPAADAGVDSPITGCTTDASCDDDNPCTTDTCSATKQCEHVAVAVDDQIACTTDACDASTGAITHTPVDTMCEQDGKTCTVATCSATTGCSETPTAIVCDDGATCSTDACDPTANGADATTGCTYTLDNSACSDTFSCTANTCSPSALASDPTTGCLVAPDDNACDDTVTCTADTCNPAGNGADTAGCVHQTMDNLCEVDGKSCTVATCSATTGCSETPSDALCNDNATCSTETCSASGPGATGCVFVLNDAACTDTAECSTDACSPGTAGADAASGCLYTADTNVCSGNATCSNAFDCTCNAGYTGDGISCTGVTCDTLSNPTNGTVTASNGGIYPSTATYACDTGFAAVPSATRTCNTDGTWSGTAPTCQPTFFVVRVGDGSAALSGTSTAVFLEERDTTGTLLRTIALPTAAAGSNVPFTVAGSSTSEGGLSLSANRAYVTLAGYAAVPGIAAIAATSNRSSDAFPTYRIVARVAASGTIDTSTRLVDAFSGANVRAACTIDGTEFWVSGTSMGSPNTGGVHHVAFASTGTTTQVFAGVNNMRHVHIYASQLYASTASGATTRGVLAIGSGAPTTTGQSAIRVAGSDLATPASSPNSFALLDLDPNVAGPDTFYLAVDTGGVAGTVNLEKWTFNGTSWSEVTAFAPTVTGGGTPNTVGLAAWADGTTAHLVVTTSETATRVLKIVDDGSTNTPAATVLATAATNTAFRGVARSPTQ